MKQLALLAVLAACGGTKPIPVHDDDAVVSSGREGDDDHIAEPTPGVDRALLDEAMRMLAAMRTTLYVHRTQIDEAAGVFAFDCSGFVDYALARAQPRALAELRTSTTKRPLAKHFVEFFQSLPEAGRGAWRPLASAREIAPGDVIAWLKPSDVVSSNTGHVMIVRAPARRDPDRADVVIVPVIDSSAVPHGKGDSRKHGQLTGLGTGEVLLLLDSDAVPIGYRWSSGTRAPAHMTTIALARLVATFPSASR